MNKLISHIKLKNIAIAFGVAIFFMADRGLKTFAQSLGPDAYYNLAGGWAIFRFTPDPYISFSLPLKGVLLNIITISIVVGLLSSIFYLKFNKDNKFIKKSSRKDLIILLTIIVFGAISNLQDRLYYGYVIDYLEIKNFTVLSLAHIMISIGTLLTIKCYLKKN